MRRLGKMINQLSHSRKQWESLMAASNTLQSSLNAEPEADHLVEVTDFGSDPGNLRMLVHVPEQLAASPALVVVLHGCTQTAAGYDQGAGWSKLADRYGFVVLLPEQRPANNPKRCFNWFQAEDTQRDRGEARSIREMVERAVADHNVDRSRIFVTGLSAGGGMTSTMLAAYPEVFAGGAIVAGLPYRCATSVPEAFECMFQGQSRPAKEWGDLVRAASSHRGPWPKVSIWHGSADTTVKPVNAEEIVKQWTDVHGLSPRPNRSETVDGYPRRVWTNAAGEDVIEEYSIAGMAHGTPLATGSGENHYGAAGPFLLEVGISSSYHIAKFWGLTGQQIDARKEEPLVLAAAEARHDKPALEPAFAKWAAPDASAKAAASRKTSPSPLEIGSIITKALRSAGLMK